MGVVVGIIRSGQASWLEEKQVEAKLDGVKFAMICEVLGGDSRVFDVANSTDKTCYRYWGCISVLLGKILEAMVS